MKKILITGGSGFIGTNLIELFEKKRYIFINYDKSVPINSSQEKYWIKGNLLEPTSLEETIDKFKPNIIVHLAARTDCESNKIEDYIDNTKGTQNLINCIKNYNFIERTVITSTQYVYKSKTKPFPSNDEEYVPYTIYGESKAKTEIITRNANLTCCWTIVRPTNVWGPWHKRYPNELWKMIGKGFYFHPGKKAVIRTYAYVKNVVYQIDQIINASDERVNKKTFYLGDLPIDSFLWLNSLSKEIRNKQIKRIPILVFLFLSLIGSALRKVGIPFPLYITRFNNMIEDFYAPTNVAINEFGLRNARLDDNVKETISWLKNEGFEFFPYWKNLNKY